MQVGRIIKNFGEFYYFVKPFSCGHSHLEEFCKFYEEIDQKCECSKINLINRAINYYLKLPQVLKPEEIKEILTKNNQKPLILMYQNQIMHTFSESPKTLSSSLSTV